MKTLRLALTASVLMLFSMLLTGAAQATPQVAGGCSAITGYDPACDVNHDGRIDVYDIQLTAGHWSEHGFFTSDNSHNHLGQTWTGSNNPLKINGAFGSPDFAPLVLSNSAVDGSGLSVTSTFGNGVTVPSAGVVGVRVHSAGSPTGLHISNKANGFEVNGAQGNGLYVGRADEHGVQVLSAGQHGVTVNAGWDGFHVTTADDDGLEVFEAGGDGVDVKSVSASHYGGKLVNSANGGAGVYARGGGNNAADLILGGTNDANDDGRIYSEPSLADSDILLFSNDEAHVHLDEDNNSGSAFVVYNGTNANVWSVGESGMAVAAGLSAVRVDAGKAGQRLTYAVTSPQNWIEDFGSGRLLEGEAVIKLETAYAETLSAEQPYHVFLTPLGDCALYVAEKAAASFTVRASGGETCSVAFDYRIVGSRRGYETVRLEQFAEVRDE